MRCVQQRLGHELAGIAEQAKVDAAELGTAHIDLRSIEPSLSALLGPTDLMRALSADLDRIAQAALVCAKQAHIKPGDVELIYFTGGSSRLKPLCDRVASQFANAQQTHGDSFASVAKGLGVYAASLQAAQQ
jgi:hypothetical chaperone protein